MITSPSTRRSRPAARWWTGKPTRSILRPSRTDASEGGHAIDVQEIIQLQDQFYILSTSSLADDRTSVLKQDETFAIMWAQVSAAPPTLTSRRPDLPAAADPVLAKALAKAPGDRYLTCLEFATALRRACGLGGGSEPVREG